MCQSPTVLADGQKVACRVCDLCRANRLNDIIGRCVAEQVASSATFAVTLTYRGETPSAYTLVYRDVQRLLKRLRIDGYSVRYICAGEYGAKKGRAHWHLVLFFRGKYPDVPIDHRIDWPYWPHGLVYFQQPDYNGFKYVMKYALKSVIKTPGAPLLQPGSELQFQMSKKPPLGWYFLNSLAEELVSKGLALHKPEFCFSFIKQRTKDNVYSARKFWISGRSQELFFQRYVSLWEEIYGKPPPSTPYLEERYFDLLVRRAVRENPEALEAEIAARQAEYEKGRSARQVVEAQASARQVGILLLPYPEIGVAVLYSDGQLRVQYGDDTWHLCVGSASGASVAEQFARGPHPRPSSGLQQQLSLWASRLLSGERRRL